MHYNATTAFLHQLSNILKMQMALSYTINVRVAMVTDLTLLTWSILEEESYSTSPFTV